MQKRVVFEILCAKGEEEVNEGKSIVRLCFGGKDDRG